jgi:hypothetical protein
VHTGVVVRSVNGRTSIRFEPLSQLAKNGLQKVIDDEIKRGDIDPRKK